MFCSSDRLTVALGVAPRLGVQALLFCGWNRRVAFHAAGAAKELLHRLLIERGAGSVEPREEQVLLAPIGLDQQAREREKAALAAERFNGMLAGRMMRHIEDDLRRWRDESLRGLHHVLSQRVRQAVEKLAALLAAVVASLRRRGVDLEIRW